MLGIVDNTNQLFFFGDIPLPFVSWLPPPWFPPKKGMDILASKRPQYEQRIKYGSFSDTS